MKTAKVFQNGRSQAVRIPWEFRFRSREVFVRRTSEGVLLTEKTPWDLFEEGIAELSEDFMAERNQPPPQVRDF